MILLPQQTLKLNKPATTAVVRITTGNELSQQTLKAIVKAVGTATKGKKAAVTPLLSIEKMKAGKLESALRFNPIKSTLKTTLKLGVKLTDRSVLTAMNKKYSNSVAIVKFDQKGSFGMPVEVIAKMDLSKLNAKALQFYSYDSAKNTVTLIATPNYSIDKDGYLHFTTTIGNHVVITDRVLTPK